MSSIDSESPPPILAVTIGINEYDSPDYDNLSGAVGDADSFEAFLKGRLKVPEANIKSLRDRDASREAIISSFTWLRDNPTYRRGEVAMIFYYAGHGAQTEKPTEWEDWETTTGFIEMLCPSDIGTTKVAKINGRESEEIIQGIPDRTISVLLNHISDTKGNNITIILDCCSSGGMVRSEDKDGHVIRRLTNPPPITTETDENIFMRGTRGIHHEPSSSGKFRASYVLMAACGREQFALEDPKSKRGLFTTQLLQVLDKDDVRSLTYVSLMHKLKMPDKQTPHAEGEGMYWRLFNNRVSGADPSFILTKRAIDGPTILQAGSAQGITLGSRFVFHATNLFDHPNLPNPRLGHLVATSVDTFSSTLEFPLKSTKFRLPRLFYSKLEQLANVRKFSVYSADRIWLESIIPSDVQAELSITVVDDVQICDLEITLLQEMVHFDRHNHLVTPLIGSRIRHTVHADDIDTVHEVIRGSLKFYYHLTRTAPVTFEGVHMELQELTEHLTEEFDTVFKPTGKNLIDKEPATIVVDENAQLGMTVHNNSDLTLYPSLFYFDPTDLTVVDWYKPPLGAGAANMTTRVDAPLPPNSKLAIGYGDGGATPWQFLLPPGEKKDLGFFRLFLSTRPSSFENILQELPPFESGSTRGGRSDSSEYPEAGTWGVQTVTLIQIEKEDVVMTG